MLSAEERFDLVIQVFAPKRSGSHALLNWLASQFPSESVVFYNDVFLPNNPLVHRKSPSGLPVLNREKNYTHNHSKRRICLISYEDKLIERVSGLAKQRESWFGVKDEQIPKVILLRDVLNCFASRLETTENGKRNQFGEAGWVALKMTSEEGRSQLVEMWKAYAREILGETNHLHPRICVSFNKWFSDVAYRKELSSKLPDTTFNDAELNSMSGYGYGSSFDSMEYETNAQEMKINSRYLQVSPEKRKYLDKIRSDDELMELNRRIFGDIYQ